MSTSPLISAQQLQAWLSDGHGVVLLDCGFDLADATAGERAHDQGHVPGAIYAHLDRDLAAPKTGTNGRHPLPSREAFARTLGEWGVAPGVRVVAYDAQGGMYAARAWWMLRWMGHADAHVLDGGLAAWAAAGGALQAQTHSPTAEAPYPAATSSMPMLDADALWAALGQRKVVDARAAERFRGDVEPLDPVAGHIPGAMNRFFKDNLQANGQFKAAELLRAEWQRFGPVEQQVHQCGSGVTACHNLLALAHAGLEGAALYPGSWSEWCASPERPVAKG